LLPVVARSQIRGGTRLYGFLLGVIGASAIAGAFALPRLKAWGQVARMAGAPLAHFLAAARALLAIPLTWRWKLHSAADVDLSPSSQWPVPIVSSEIPADAGPALVMIEYRINKANREPFLRALEQLSRERRRDGAYAWGAFEDTAEPGRYVETFLVESWLEHLRQHERVTRADRVLQDHVHRYLMVPAQTTHLVSAYPHSDGIKHARS